MKIVGPIYRLGAGDPRIDDKGWYALPPVPVFVNHQLNRPVGRATLAWSDDFLMCHLPMGHPAAPATFERWGYVSTWPYLGFAFAIVPAPSGEGADGVQIVEVSLLREPQFDLPAWTLEDD